ncbi:hypothetical protein Droror1_Dr00017545 [Drosera rotundifolia]
MRNEDNRNALRSNRLSRREERLLDEDDDDDFDLWPPPPPRCFPFPIAGVTCNDISISSIDRSCPPPPPLGLPLVILSRFRMTGEDDLTTPRVNSLFSINLSIQARYRRRRPKRREEDDRNEETKTSGLGRTSIEKQSSNSLGE